MPRITCAAGSREVLSGRQRSAARRAYVRMLRGQRRELWIGEGPGRLPWWHWGDGEEIALVEGKPRLDGLGAGTVPGRARVSVDEYLAQACQIWEMEPGDLLDRRKDEGMTRMRELIIMVGVEEYGLRVKDLAARLRMNPGSASRALTRAVGREREDEAFHERRRDLQKRLARGEVERQASRR